MSDVEQSKPNLKEVISFDQQTLKSIKTVEKTRVPTAEEILAEKKALAEEAKN